jgi:hypothetical protein
MAALLLLLPSPAVRAQTSMTAFLPEIDSYFRVTPNVRLVFDAKGYMEDGDLNRAQIGPSCFSPTSVQFKGEINDALPRKRHQKRHLEF